MNMATDLPSRPTPDPEDRSEVLDPTERVKSLSDKTDPRFKAALDRAEREERLRAKAARTESGAAGGNEPQGAVGGTSPAPEKSGMPGKGTFSFNQTAGETEDQK